MPDEIRVLLVDDHPIFLQGLVWVIENEADIKIVGKAENGEAALEIIQDQKPDIVYWMSRCPALMGLRSPKSLSTTSLKQR